MGSPRTGIVSLDAASVRRGNLGAFPVENRAMTIARVHLVDPPGHPAGSCGTGL